MNSPIVRARRKPDVSYECETTDRIFMPSECPDDPALPPELDRFVRRAFNTNKGEPMMGKQSEVHLPVINSSPSIATTVKTD